MRVALERNGLVVFWVFFTDLDWRNQSSLTQNIFGRLGGYVRGVLRGVVDRERWDVG
jgi:hypothetical protein